MNPTLILIPVLTYTGIACAWDLRTRRIPNWLTVGFFVAGIAFHTINRGWEGLGHSLAGFAVGFGILLVLWLIGGGGAGDVKLMGGLGAWLGAPLTMIVIVSSALLGLFGMIAFVAWRFVTHGPTKSEKESTNVMKRTIPYAIPVAVVTWMLLGIKVLTVQPAV